MCDSLPPSTTDLQRSLKTVPASDATDMPPHRKNQLNTRNPKRPNESDATATANRHGKTL